MFVVIITLEMQCNLTRTNWVCSLSIGYIEQTENCLVLVIKVLFIISSHNFISLPSHKQAKQHSLSTHTHKKTSHFHSIFLIYVLKHIYRIYSYCSWFYASEVALLRLSRALKHTLTHARSMCVLCFSIFPFPLIPFHSNYLWPPI